MELSNVIIADVRDDGLVIGTTVSENKRPLNVAFYMSEAESVITGGSLSKDARVDISCSGETKGFLTGISSIRVTGTGEPVLAQLPVQQGSMVWEQEPPESPAPERRQVKPKKEPKPKKEKPIKSDEPVEIKDGYVHGLIIKTDTYHRLLEFAMKDEPRQADRMMTKLLNAETNNEQLLAGISMDRLIEEISIRGERICQETKEISPEQYATACSFLEYVEMAAAKYRKYNRESKE